MAFSPYLCSQPTRALLPLPEMPLHKSLPRVVGNLDVLRESLTSLAQLGRFQLVGQATHNHYAGKRYEIPDVQGAAFGAVELGDVDLNFFLRVMLEGRFRTAIEIGAAGCHRIKSLARLLPEIEAHALDIGPAFGVERQDGGVRIGPFEPAFFEVRRERAVVFTSATLACLRPPELDDFLRLLAGHGYALALSEPGFRFGVDRALPRNRLSYYHPWRQRLEAAGFALVEAKAGVKNCAWRLRIPKANGEHWLQILAQPRGD